jgi:hypothetical protein
MDIFGTHPPKNEYFGKGEGFFYYSSPRNHLYVRVDNLFANELNYQSLKKQNTKTYMNLYLKTVSVKSHSLNHLELGLWMLSLGQAEEN